MSSEKSTTKEIPVMRASPGTTGAESSFQLGYVRFLRDHTNEDQRRTLVDKHQDDNQLADHLQVYNHFTGLEGNNVQLQLEVQEF